MCACVSVRGDIDDDDDGDGKCFTTLGNAMASADGTQMQSLPRARLLPISLKLSSGPGSTSDGDINIYLHWNNEKEARPRNVVTACRR